MQHVAPERPYAIAEALVDAAVAVDVRVMSSRARLPRDLDGFQAMVVMGGPMSATSDEAFPTRGAEIALLEEALDRGLPALGICLGAQLLALAAGGKVYPGAEGPEIGWAPVSLTNEARTDPLLAGLPGELTVLHWHADTFDLPPGATHLASSKVYPNQAFRVDQNAWGFQFHLEVDDEAVGAFLAAFGTEAEAAGVEPAAVAAGTPASVARLADARRPVLERFARLAQAGGAG